MEILRVPTSIASYKLPIPINVIGSWVAIATASSDSSEYYLDGLQGYIFNEEFQTITVESLSVSDISLQYLPKLDDDYSITIKTAAQSRLDIVAQVWNSGTHRTVLLGAITLTGQAQKDYMDTEEYKNATDAKENVLSILENLDVVVFEDDFTYVRPYSNPETNASTASEIAAYSANEEIARAVIDSVIPEGFYYKRKVLHFTGTGSDYLPVWDDVKKVVSVYENNKLVEDREFELTSDKTAIVEKSTDNINRAESAPLVLPAASSDSLDPQFVYRGFGKTWDYVITVEYGYPTIPSDIVRATEMLVHDLECGKLDYYKRFISSYNTDQYRIQFDKGLFEGTGNIIVDKILSKYAKSITKIGVL
jgi:hypothetical protein